MQLRHDAYPELERDLRFQPLGSDKPKILTTDQVDRYNDDGFLVPIRIFDAAEIAEIRTYCDGLLAKATAAGWNSYELINWHKSCAGLHDLVTESRIIDIVQDLLGDTVILRHSHFFVKMPGDGKRVSWHQDMSYWPLTKSRVVTAWLAIDDSDEKNAAMQVIPGSHLTPRIPFVDSAASENNVLNQTVPNAEEYGRDPVTLKLRAGEVSLHSDLTLHSSEINHSNRRRCGLAMRFLSPDVKAYNGWNAHSIICRGEDPSGHWTHHPRPSGELIPVKPADFADGTMEELVSSKPE